jgi:hypothetical protein
MNTASRLFQKAEATIAKQIPTAPAAANAAAASLKDALNRAFAGQQGVSQNLFILDSFSYLSSLFI